MAMTTTTAIPIRGAADPLTAVKRRTPAGDAMRTLRQRPVAMLGLAILLTWIALGLLAPVLPLEAQNGQIKIENKLEPNEKGYLDKIINSSHRMQVLIEDVLTLSKLSNTDLPFEKTDLQTVISHIMEDLEITIRDKGTEVHVGNLPTVEAVPGQMHQLFQNLISNTVLSQPTTQAITAKVVLERGLES